MEESKDGDLAAVDVIVFEVDKDVTISNVVNWITENSELWNIDVLHSVTRENADIIPSDATKLVVGTDSIPVHIVHAYTTSPIIVSTMWCKGYIKKLVVEKDGLLCTPSHIPRPPPKSE